MASLQPQSPALDFVDQAQAVVCRLRDAIAAVIAAIPGFAYRRPNDLAADLGLDAKLAWRLGRCVDVADPFASAQFIPGPTGMRTFLRVAQRRGVPKSALDVAREAFDDFRELVRTHGGTRKSFDTLTAGLAASGQVRTDLEHRRLAFEGNTYVWGVWARTIFRANIIAPSADPNMWDLATVRGFIDFRRMRPNVAWRIVRPSSVDSSHSIHTEAVRAALDPRAAEGVPLLTDFCSQPVPQFRSVVGLNGGQESEFVAGPVGNTGRLTCVTGEVLRGLEPRYRAPLYGDFCAVFPVRTPAEVLVFDLLIHRTLFENDDPLRVELYSDLFGGGPGVRYEATDRLPLHDSLACLGYGPEAAHTSDIPRYPDMLRYALDRVDWNGHDFRLYRLRMQYPAIPTTVMLRKTLPERPVGA
jgi:hypothetical protein